MLQYIIIFAAPLIAIIYAFYTIKILNKIKVVDKEMADISLAIRDGSSAYLKRQYSTVAIVALIITVLVWIFIGLNTAIGFVIGSTTSALAGYIGMMIAVSSNVKTAEEAKNGLGGALKLAFRAGSVTGMLVVSFALLVVAGFYLIFKDFNALIGLGFGASLISVFARLGGGIFTKAADVGTDLVGKMEAGIPEDDPRNPGVIADNVGDNVGDCAGMAADLFETYAITLAAAILLGATIIGTSIATIFPMILGGISICASLIGIFFVRVNKKSGSIMGALYKGLFAAIIFAAVGFYFVSRTFFGAGWGSIFLESLVGLFVTIFIVISTDYYTSKTFRPVKSIAKASESGHGTNIIMGISVGMESTLIPVITIVVAIALSYLLGGLYGIAIASVGMLSVAGIIISIDSFGPITDNAGGIAEMTHQGKDVRKITDALDAVGNTTKAITKGYAIGSAALAALVLFSGYASELPNVIFDLSNYKVMIGLLLGALIPYFFGATTLRSVSRAASAVVNEVRRQFREIDGLLDGNAKPEYGKAVDIVTKAAIKEMIVPSLIPVLAVIIVGFLFGAQALGGFLIGVIISGVFMAISMTSGGAAWDNAKKYIEEGHYGGRGSLAHKAAITGDMVGDPYKDTTGPAINPLIKVINVIALLIVKFLR